MKIKKKKKKNKKIEIIKIFNIKNIVLLIIGLISLIIFIISLFNIISWHQDNRKTDKQIKDINEVVEIDEINDNSNAELINEPENIDEFNPYWDYINMSLINVEFGDLKNQNSDTVGWIKVNGTNINYPFVQTSDNTFYLNHSFNKKYNNSGWVFLDYRNNIKELDKNTIIYAHGRVNGTMFGSLKNILSSGWLNDTNNYVVKLSTETENTLWQVFSIYHIPTTNDYIQVKFINDDKFLEFANMLKNRSQYNFNADLVKEDKILTLSTCYNDNEKVVLHAKLIKREGR